LTKDGSSAHLASMHRILLLNAFACTLGISVLGAQAPISAAYTFTEQSFAPVVQALPEPVRAAVLANPKAFLDDYKPLLTQPADLLILVDKNNEIPADYEPDDLVTLKAPAFPANHPGIRFRKVYLPPLKLLLDASKKAGLKLTISSGYRSWIYQKDLFQRYVAKDGLATAERYSARPGRSQHQLGTVLDFGSVTPEFADTKEGRWLAEHAEDAGFSMSFPEGQETLTGYIFEPWHFRYIGIQACAVQKKWFGDLQQWLTEFHRTQGPILRASLKK